jgi:UDP-glucose 4-epimerase
MNSVVTGGAGYIGSHLVRKLIERGDNVRVLDDLSTGSLENLSGLEENYELFKGDICDPFLAGRALKGTEVVYHLGAKRDIPDSMANPFKYHDVNVLGTLNLLDVAKEEGVDKFVFASSSSVYGNGLIPSSEDDVCNPISPYGASKLASEVYCNLYNKMFGLGTTNLRYFNVYGHPTPSAQSLLIHNAKKSLESNLPLTIYGDGEMSRDYVFIDDVVEATILAGLTVRGGETFNVCSGNNYTTKEIYQGMRKIMGSGRSPRYTGERVGDVQMTLGNPIKAERDLDWSVKVDILDGLEITIKETK